MDFNVPVLAQRAIAIADRRRPVDSLKVTCDHRALKEQCARKASRARVCPCWHHNGTK